MAATLAAAEAASGTAAAQTPPVHLTSDNPARLNRHALCLSGGGARGAYEAGIIEYLRLSKQISNGAVLQPYGIVCGTSIGALNSYFVATGQYDLLRDLWYSIAYEHVVKLKPEYATAVENQAGLGNRIAAAMNLAFGLAKHDTGVLDGSVLRDFLVKFIKPETPVLIPAVWVATNITTMTPEFFYMVGTQLTPEQREFARRAVRDTVGPLAVLREATPDILIDSLRASAAIPVAFDPVPLPSVDGKDTHYYVDGGVTANTPIDVARAAAAKVDVVMLDPPVSDETYTSAVEIGMGVFGTMQRRILLSDVRAAYLETVGKRALDSQPNKSPELTAYAATLYASEFAYVRPAAVLPVQVAGFDDADNIYKTYKLGFEAVVNGFTPFDYAALAAAAEHE